MKEKALKVIWVVRVSKIREIVAGFLTPEVISIRIRPISGINSIILHRLMNREIS